MVEKIVVAGGGKAAIGAQVDGGGEYRRMTMEARASGRSNPAKQIALHVVVRGHERQVNPVDILLVKDLDDVVSMAFDWSRVRRGCLMR
jgi:hypothetical protein